MWFKSNVDTIIFGLIAGLIFIWVLIVWSNPPSKQAYNPYDAPKCEVESCEGLAPPPNVNPKTGQTKKTTNKEIEEWRANRSDLAAQWETADATRVAFRSAILGIWLLFWTIWATKKTTYFAEKTLSSTKDTSYKELRAYLGVVLTAAPIKDGDETLAVNVTIKNFGQTPAYNIKISHLITYVNVPWGDLLKNQATVILNPTESFSPIFESAKTDVSKVKKTPVYFYLKIIFTDMNRCERWAKMTFSKDGKDWPVRSRRVIENSWATDGGPQYENCVVGNETLYLVKMETSDLRPDENYDS